MSRTHKEFVGLRIPVLWSINCGLGFRFFLLCENKYSGSFHASHCILRFDIACLRGPYLGSSFTFEAKY